MMVAFKILMIFVSVLSFMGSMVEKETAKQKTLIALFTASGTLFLLAEIASKIH